MLKAIGSARDERRIPRELRNPRTAVATANAINGAYAHAYSAPKARTPHARSSSRAADSTVTVLDQFSRSLIRPVQPHRRHKHGVRPVMLFMTLSSQADGQRFNRRDPHLGHVFLAICGAIDI